MTVFRLWHGFNSGMWDDQASDLVGQLSIAHLDPARSDPSMIAKTPRGIFNTPEEEAANPSHAKALRAHKARLFDVAGEIEEDDDGLNYWIKPEVLSQLPSQADPSWQGIRKDVGIFTDQEFEFIMSKCLRSLSTSPRLNSADNRCTCWRCCSLVERHVAHSLRCASQQKDGRGQEAYRSSSESC